MHLDTDKQNILILGTPRSGTGALTKYIAKKFNNIHSVYEEPDIRKNDMDSFILDINEHRNFIVKIQMISFNTNNYDGKVIDHLLHDPNIFRISVKRKNIIDQISSLYLSLMTPNGIINRWHQYRTDEYKFYVDEVPTNFGIISTSIKKIVNSYELLNNVEKQIDMNLWYEDLPIMDDIDVLVGPKPNNYDQIKSTIETYYNDYINSK